MTPYAGALEAIDRILNRGGDADDVLMVTAHQTLVLVDLDERKARTIPEWYREKVGAFEGGDLEQ